MRPPGVWTNVLRPYWEGGKRHDPVHTLAEEFEYSDGYGIRQPAHQMLGYPANIQSDPLTPGLVLLLQLDSDEDAGIEWGDVGALYCFVQENDLRAVDFSHAWMTWVC